MSLLYICCSWVYRFCILGIPMMICVIDYCYSRCICLFKYVFDAYRYFWSPQKEKNQPNRAAYIFLSCSGSTPPMTSLKTFTSRRGHVITQAAVGLIKTFYTGREGFGNMHSALTGEIITRDARERHTWEVGGSSPTPRGEKQLMGPHPPSLETLRCRYLRAVSTIESRTKTIWNWQVQFWNFSLRPGHLFVHEMLWVLLHARPRQAWYVIFHYNAQLTPVRWSGVSIRSCIL